MKMPFFVADKTQLTRAAAEIEDRIYSKQPTTLHQRRFLAAFIPKCSHLFGGAKGLPA